MCFFYFPSINISYVKYIKKSLLKNYTYSLYRWISSFFYRLLVSFFFVFMFYTHFTLFMSFKKYFSNISAVSSAF